MSDSKQLGSTGRPKPPAAGMGRKAGTPNKVTGEVKQMILEALDNAGGVKYLTEQATENPKAFLTLVGKVLPMQITGKDDGPIQITEITRRIIKPK